jgi:hypothetical protein
MSNRNSKKFSLLVFCLIIGGLFFTNIHNNVLGVNSKSALTALTEDERTKLVQYIVKNMFVMGKEQDTITSNIETLSEGWMFTQEMDVVNSDCSYVVFPINFVNNRSLKILNPSKIKSINSDVYDQQSKLAIVYLQLEKEEYIIRDYDISWHIKDKPVITEFLQSHSINYADYWIYLKKVREQKTWKTQLDFVKKSDKFPQQTIDINDQKVNKALEEIWNTLILNQKESSQKGLDQKESSQKGLVIFGLGAIIVLSIITVITININKKSKLKKRIESIEEENNQTQPIEQENNKEDISQSPMAQE